MILYESFSFALEVEEIYLEIMTVISKSLLNIFYDCCVYDDDDWMISFGTVMVNVYVKVIFYCYMES